MMRRSDSKLIYYTRDKIPEIYRLPSTSIIEPRFTEFRKFKLFNYLSNNGNQWVIIYHQQDNLSFSIINGAVAIPEKISMGQTNRFKLVSKLWLIFAPQQ